MPTVQPELGELLATFEGPDNATVKRFQDFRASMDAKGYLLLVRQAVAEHEVSDGLAFAAAMLDIHDLTQTLLETYLNSKDKALALAGRLAASDPRFDASMLQCLRDGSQGWSDDALLVGLDILDAVSERDRLVLNVLRLLKDSNPKLRSKAASFIARRRPQLKWVSDLSLESDARVRANTIESLFGMNEEFIASLFRLHVSDENNRVAGNALLGLYKLGDTCSIALLDRMAKDQRALFRGTSAWVMGQTGDPRFSNNLATQLSDADKVVRRQALLGLGHIKDAFKTARERSPLRVNVFRHRLERNREQLVIRVATCDGQIVKAVPGTRFLIKSGGVFVRDYTVEECDSNIPINLYFVECLPKNEEDSAGRQFEEAMGRCGGLKRAKDKVSVSRLNYETQLQYCTGDSASASVILSKAFGDVDFSVPNLHIVIVGATRERAIIEKVVEFTAGLTASVHLIALAPEWRDPELSSRLSDRGGYVRIADPATLSDECFDLHAALLHHYRLEWDAKDGGVELEIRADVGTGCINVTRERG